MNIKYLLPLLAVLSLAPAQAAVLNTNAQPKITITSQYDGRAPYTEVFLSLRDTHIDLVDPMTRLRWCDRWQPESINPAIFKSRQDTEQAIQNMIQSLNRKYDSLFTQSSTTSEKAWFDAKGTVRQTRIGDIAYVQIPSFLPRGADREVQQALASSANAKGIIIDLRGNTGGLITSALNVAAMLIPEGTVYVSQARLDDRMVETKLSLGKNRWETRTSGTPGSTPKVTSYPNRTNLVVSPSVPVVVLVDGRTASAAELLTGSLKQNHRAVVIGTRTVGKGTGMKLAFLSSNGRALQVTFEKLLPGGVDIDGSGIQPDVVIQRPQGAEDYQLQAAIKALGGGTENPPLPPPTPTVRTQHIGGSPYVRNY